MARPAQDRVRSVCGSYLRGRRPGLEYAGKLGPGTESNPSTTCPPRTRRARRSPRFCPRQERGGGESGRPLLVRARQRQLKPRWVDPVDVDLGETPRRARRSPGRTSDGRSTDAVQAGAELPTAPTSARSQRVLVSGETDLNGPVLGLVLRDGLATLSSVREARVRLAPALGQDLRARPTDQRNEHAPDGTGVTASPTSTWTEPPASTRHPTRGRHPEGLWPELAAPAQAQDGHGLGPGAARWYRRSLFAGWILSGPCSSWSPGTDTHRAGRRRP